MDKISEIIYLTNPTGCQWTSSTCFHKLILNINQGTFLRHESPIYATPTKFIFEILIFDKIPTLKSQKKGKIPYNLHPLLKFTIEKEVNDSIPFLDIKIIKESGRFAST